MDIVTFSEAQSRYLSLLARRGPQLPQGSAYPKEMSLKANMPPIVNDQFVRGTCAANAAVALAEYFFRSRGVRLSAQYLYASARSLVAVSGEKMEDEGLSIEQVLNALQKQGTCRYDLAQYARTQEDLDFAEFSEECHKDASVNRTPIPSMIYPPTNIEAIKATICGVANQLPMPVVIGVDVFSSFSSCACREDGMVDLPRYVTIPGEAAVCFGTDEEPQGGHAMLVVGYRDDVTCPGGGWFEVLNSWGVGSGAKGYLRLPYAYVEMFCSEAGTFRVDKAYDQRDAGESSAKPKRDMPLSSNRNASPSQLVQYETLKESQRDTTGRRWPVGTEVVRVGDVIEPVIGGDFRSPAYVEALRREVFRAGVPSEIGSRCLQFAEKIEDNLSIGRMKMSLFPERASWNMFRIVNGRRIWRSEKVAEFTNELRDAVLADMMNDARNQSLPSVLASVGEMKPSDDWRKMITNSFVGKIYKISGFFPGRCAYAVEAFVTRWTFDRDRGFIPVRATACELQRVIECAEKVVPQLKSAANLIFYAVGTGLPAGQGYEAGLFGSRVVTVSSPSVDGDKWTVNVAPNLTRRMPFRDFCDRLMPITQDELVSVVKTRVDKVIRAGMNGHSLYVEEIVKDIHELGPYSEFPSFRRTAVTRALLHLREHDPSAYVICQVERPSLGVAVMSPGDVAPGDRPFRSRSRIVNFLIHHALRLTSGALCVGIIIVKGKYLTSVPLWETFLAMLATWLIGSWLQDKIVELSEIEKE